MITTTCKVCKKEMKAYRSTINKKKYCSDECKKTITHKKANCLFCSKDFLIAKSLYNQKSIKNHCCSKECYESLKTNIEKKSKLKKTFTCSNCKKVFLGHRSGKTNLKFCSQKCSIEYMKGKNSPFYNGGTITAQGYKAVKVGEKYILEHRLIMEEFLGRKLVENEVVHHIDENKLNNNIENLKLMDRKEHDRLHTTKRHELEPLFGNK